MNSEAELNKNSLANAFIDNRELLQVMMRLQAIKATTPKAQAKANATSMTDNNGKRILYMLTEDMLQD